ncbi:carbonic anhydrase [Xylariaceae sp. FL1651]|nr:carbonic anhydrase [Xylariaceae sp. FL1651]
MASLPKTILVFAAMMMPVLGFCGAHTYLDPREEGSETVPVASFGYFGSGGPLMWHRLDAANALCATGKYQSPINMVPESFTLVPGSNLTVTLPADLPQGATFENLGSTIEVVMEGLGGSLLFDGLDYNLTQFHFHHPSEHVNNGVSMPMEMHMVFTHETTIAVIGVYIDLTDAAPSALTSVLPGSASSAMLETIFSSIDAIASPGEATKTPAFGMSELNEVLACGSYQRYSGSLTSPPCSEEVSWSVSTNKLLLSRETYLKVRDVVGFNSRFPQNAPGLPNLLELAHTA